MNKKENVSLDETKNMCFSLVSSDQTYRMLVQDGAQEGGPICSLGELGHITKVTKLNGVLKGSSR